MLWVDATVHWKLNTIAFSNKEGYVSVWTRALDMFVRSFHFFCGLAKVECFKRFCHFWNYCDCSFFRFSLQLLEQVGFGNVKAVDNTARFVEVLKVERARFETEKSLFLKVQKKYMYMYMLIHVLQEFKETLGPFIPGKVKRVCYIRLVPNKMQIVPFIPACLT